MFTENKNIKVFQMDTAVGLAEVVFDTVEDEMVLILNGQGIDLEEEEDVDFFYDAVMGVTASNQSNVPSLDLIKKLLPL